MRRRFALPVLRIALRPPPQLGFVLRTLLAFAIAVRIAYGLELGAAYSAGITVVIVAANARGAVLSKSLWRLAGSFAGVVASVVLIASFAQAPLLFVVALAAWLGLCTAVSSMLRYFRSYGVVLAGYTATLVGVPATAAPRSVFLLATDRLAVVAIGVLTCALVFLLTDSGPRPRALRRQAASLAAATARLAECALGDTQPARLADQRAAIARRLIGFDQQIEFTADEDAVFGARAADLRQAAANLFSALTGAAALGRSVRAADPAFRLALARVLDRFASAIASPFQHGAAALDAAPASLPATDPALLAEAALLLGQLRDAATHFAVLDGRAPSRPAAKLPVYGNPVTALRNGARAFLATLLAGLFWIETQWPTGGTALAMLGPMTGLLAQSESAAAASVAFLQGVFVSAVVGLFLREVVLPQISGFPLLMAALLPVMGISLFFSQRADLVGTRANAFLIFIVTQIAPANPMRFDLAAALNASAALVMGGVFGVLSFRVLLPPNPLAEARYLLGSIRRAARSAASGRMPATAPLAWEHLQHQKLVRLSQRLHSLPHRRHAALDRAIALVLIGRLKFRLRLLLGANLPGPIRAAGRDPLEAAACAEALAEARPDLGPVPRLLARALRDGAACLGPAAITV